MSLLTFIFPYLMLIRVMLLTVSSILLFSAFAMIVLRADNLNLLDFRGGSGKNPADHRQHARYAAMGVLELPGVSNPENSSASLMNLSAKGVSFMTPHIFKVGQEIACRVHPQNKQPARVIGSVVWVKAKAHFYQYGVEFKSLVPQFAKPTNPNAHFRTLRAWGTS